MARDYVTETAYREGQYVINRVRKLPKKGSNIFLYAILDENFSKLYKWMPDETWEEIDIAGSIANTTFLQSGTNVSITGTGTSIDPYIISSLQDASGTPITAIVGLTATNVQEALEELKTQVEAIDIPDGSETIVQGAGDIDVTGSGTVGNPYIVAYDAAIQIPVIRFVKVSLTPAEVLALGTTPIVAVPAPGVGKAIEVFTAAARLIFNSVIYDGGGDFDVACLSAGLSQSQYRYDPSFLLANSNRFSILQRKVSGATPQIIENDPLVIRSLDGTVGDSPVDVYITYRIIDL